MLKKLIKYKANLNAVDDDGKSGLDYICESKQKSFDKIIASLLVKKGADINIKDKNGRSSFIRNCI